MPKTKSRGEIHTRHVAQDSAVHAVAPRARYRVVDALVDLLGDIGATYAFGCTGGTVALLCEALARSSVHVVQCRHESGAAFAATEAYFASGNVAIVFTTSGPSLLNALNGLMAARTEGAKVILLSGSTPATQRGRAAFQETSATALPHSVFARGSLFDYAVDLTDTADLAHVSRALQDGVARPGGFVAHIAVPSSLQAQTIEPLDAAGSVHALPGIRRHDALELARVLSDEPFAIWVGFGARAHSGLVRAFAERTGAPVMSSPRGRGIMPEDHPLFLGVTGLAAPWNVADALGATGVKRLLVLGSRLGELSSLWDERLVPVGGIVQVDLDPDVPRAFPSRARHLIQADVGDVLATLLEHWPAAATPARVALRPRDVPPALALRDGPIRPQVLMAEIQRHVVDATDATIYVDCGNCFAWANAYLRFSAPRYRASVGWGSMGHAAAGVVGAAMTSSSKCVALVGDGALLMQNEISTAVKYGVPAVWVVFNDAQYGMIEQGMRAGHLTPVETQIPRVDFVALAKSVGATGISVHQESELEGALHAALNATRPFVVDVFIDRNELAPIASRITSLEKQGVGRLDD